LIKVGSADSFFVGNGDFELIDSEEMSAGLIFGVLFEIQPLILPVIFADHKLKST